ncbi:hypothetical protein HDU76_013785 [Blyttiomyces sp. JEL0837]|nr:hypothetical protein HDU76_013785 [Blyttiomyces sp. JEL0837]
MDTGSSPAQSPPPQHRNKVQRTDDTDIGRHETLDAFNGSTSSTLPLVIDNPTITDPSLPIHGTGLQTDNEIDNNNNNSIEPEPTSMLSPDSQETSHATTINQDKPESSSSSAGPSSSSESSESDPATTTIKMDIIGHLPFELAIKIFSHLRGPKTLARCALVSRRWTASANSELNWRNLCKIRWSRQKHIHFELHPKVDYTSLVSSLSVKEMKGILKSRGVDDGKVKACLDKEDLKGLVSSTLPKGAMPQDGVVWRSKWKASFVVAEWEGKKTVLTKEDLCSLNWNFRMLYHEWPADRIIKAKFNRDYSYESDMLHGDRKMSWRFYANDIQVEQYPPLTIHRDKQWGYILTNNMAEFQSIWEGDGGISE